MLVLFCLRNIHLRASDVIREPYRILYVSLRLTILIKLLFVFLSLFIVVKELRLYITFIDYTNS